MSATIKRPLPAVDPESAPYWAATREHRLVVQKCQKCSTVRFPPAFICYRCRSTDYDWIEISGGTLYSWVIVNQPVIEALKGQTPYIAALVEIADKTYMPTNIVGASADELRAEMPVTVEFLDIEGNFSLPVFRPEG